jgi:plasmid maintenance system antidote protein VapI
MRILEIIELRSVSKQLNVLKPELNNLINTLNKETNDCSIKIYRHLSVDTDFSIHLQYDSNKTDNTGSTIGLQLISVLKEFGLTYHHIWCELNTKQ